MRVAGKQDLSVQRYSSIVMEKGIIVRDCRRIERLRVT
jgi:hypothetical protein